MIDKWASRKQSQDTDNILTIAYYVKLTETTYATTPYTLYRAIRSAKYKTIDAGGRPLLKEDIVFRLYKSDLLSAGMTVIPKIKDKIVTRAGTTYIISQKVTEENQMQAFVCYVQESTNV